MTEYERGFIDGIKSKVSAELTPTLINVSRTMLEMLKPVLSTALENALNDNKAITDTDVQPVNQWISVNDRLPEEEGDVLVWIVDGKPDGIHHLESEYIANWEDGNFYDGDWNVINGITHWQPLPEPPKDGDANG